MNRNIWLLTLTALVAALAPEMAFAAEEAATTALASMPIGVGLTMGVAVAGGAIGQGLAIASGLEAIGRNPSAAGEVASRMLVGLAFVESLVILAFATGYLLLNH